MKATQFFKPLGLLAITVLTAASGLAQAGHDRVRAGPGHPHHLASYGGPGYMPGHHRDDRRGHAGVDTRQVRQLDRIQHGVARGEITRREADKLFREQREIERMQRRFLADGHLSRGEYMVLDEALERAGRNIRHQAHDNEWRW